MEYGIKTFALIVFQRFAGEAKLISLHYSDCRIDKNFNPVVVNASSALQSSLKFDLSVCMQFAISPQLTDVEK